MEKKEKKVLRAAATVGAVLAGNVILAFAVTAFIVPQGIIMGGATGVGLTIAHYLHFDLSAIVLVVNVALFVMGAAALGKKFALTTLVSTFAYPLILSVVQRIPAVSILTDNRMLASVYAAILLGIGVGIIVRVGASTGGTDILALVLNKYLHIPVAALLYGVDFVVLGCQLAFSDMEQVLYGIFTLMAEMLVLPAPDAGEPGRRRDHGEHRDRAGEGAEAGRALRGAGPQALLREGDGARRGSQGLHHDLQDQ